MRYWLFTEPTNTRKGFHMLSGIVNKQMSIDLRNGDVFIFINKNRNRIKLLRKEPGGMVIYAMMLDYGRLRLPSFEEGMVRVIVSPKPRFPTTAGSCSALAHIPGCAASGKRPTSRMDGSKLAFHPEKGPNTRTVKTACGSEPQKARNGPMVRGSKRLKISQLCNYPPAKQPGDSCIIDYQSTNCAHAT